MKAITTTRSEAPVLDFHYQALPDPRVLPATVVYDPELTLGLPAGTATASGLNAMVHCVEAFWAPGRNPISTPAAREGIRALAEALPRVRREPGNPDTREGLLYGAYLAALRGLIHAAWAGTPAETGGGK